MLKSITAKSALFLGLFFVGLSNSLLCKPTKHTIEEAGSFVIISSDQLKQKLQNPHSLKKIIAAVFADDHKGVFNQSAHSYRALLLTQSPSTKNSEERYFDGKKITVNTHQLLANQSLLISNPAFQEAAINYFLTNKDYKPFGWQSLADTILITQPKVRQTILQEIQKVLQRPAARLSNQFIDSLKHVIEMAKHNYDMVLLKEIKELIEKYSRPAEKPILLKLVHIINKPTRRTCFNECTLSIDYDTDCAEAILDIRQNNPYDVVTMSTKQLIEKLNNPQDRLRIINHLLHSPFVNALDLIHDKTIAKVEKIKINNTYTEPNQTFWLSSKDVLINRSLLFNNQQVIEALACHCIQALIHGTQDAQLIISICQDKELKTVPLFKELVIKGIIQNFSNIQKPSHTTTFTVLCHLIIDLIRNKNEELLTQLINVIKQNQHKSTEYTQLIQMAENDCAQIEAATLEEDRFEKEMDADF